MDVSNAWLTEHGDMEIVCCRCRIRLTEEEEYRAMEGVPATYHNG